MIEGDWKWILCKGLIIGNINLIHWYEYCLVSESNKREREGKGREGKGKGVQKEDKGKAQRVKFKLQSFVLIRVSVSRSLAEFFVLNRSISCASRKGMPIWFQVFIRIFIICILPHRIKKSRIAYYKHIEYMDIKRKRMLSEENTESNSSSC